MKNSKQLKAWLDKVRRTDFPGLSLELNAQSRDAVGDSLLHYAALWNDANIIYDLVEWGVDIDARGEHGYTPLHEAVEQGTYESLRVLVSLGADLSIENDLGLTPLEAANVLEDSESLAILEAQSKGNELDPIFLHTSASDDSEMLAVKGPDRSAGQK